MLGRDPEQDPHRGSLGATWPERLAHSGVDDDELIATLLTVELDDDVRAVLEEA